MEKVLRRIFPKGKKGELWGGGVLAACVCFVSVLLPFCLLFAAHKLHPFVCLILKSIFCYQLLAVKSLKTESMKVYIKLKKEDLEGARQAVSMIVGRDTKNLNSEEIAKAAVETVAENTSDGVIGPMFYMGLFGPLGGFFYKAVNTMDSMIGYKNEKYLYFGRAAARLDDVLNFIPSRLSAVLMMGAAFILRLDYKGAVRIFKRDRFHHASPNSAQTEAVCAGALGVKLGGDAWYFGVLHKKDTIGDEKRKVSCEDIRSANRLLYVTAVLGIVCILGSKALITMFFDIYQ